MSIKLTKQQVDEAKLINSLIQFKETELALLNAGKAKWFLELIAEYKLDPNKKYKLVEEELIEMLSENSE